MVAFLSILALRYSVRYVSAMWVWVWCGGVPACLRYQLVKDPFEVLVEESPYFNSPRFEDPNEKIPPAKEGDIVEVRSRVCGVVVLASYSYRKVKH